MGLMLRTLVLAALALGASASEHRFEVGDVALYAYRFTHTASWASADDTRSYTTEMAWQAELVVAAVTPELITARVTVLSLTGSHRGPGANHRVDVRPHQDVREGIDDPLLGAWSVLVETPLSIDFDPTTGVVAAVRGHDALVAAYVARHSQHPSQAAGHRATAEAAFSEAHLAALWTRLLELPPASGSDTVPLQAPFASGELSREWRGDRYTLSLPSEAEPPRLVLSADPVPVELTLAEVSGEGALSVSGGKLLARNGHVELTLRGSAQTQPVTQEHRLSWEFRRLDRDGLSAELPGPAGGDGTGETAEEAPGEPAGEPAATE